MSTTLSFILMSAKLGRRITMLTVGKIAEKYGVSRTALLYCDRLGLVSPSARGKRLPSLRRGGRGVPCGRRRAPYLVILPALSASIMVVAVSYTVVAQKAVTGDVAGGVFSVKGSVGNLTLPLSMLVYGFLLERADVGLVALGSGAAVVVLLTLAVLLSSIRRAPSNGSRRRMTTKAPPHSGAFRFFITLRPWSFPLFGRSGSAGMPRAG